MKRLAVLTLALAACGEVSPPPNNNPDSPDPDAGVDGPRIDAMGPDATVPTVPPEVDGRIVINEVMVKNALTIDDETGQPSDWIELYNPTDQDLSLHGYAITDDLARPLAFHLDGLIIRAGGHLVLWADGRAEVSPFHVGFELDVDGGELGLARPDGTYIDRVRWDKQETDFSFARTPDGSDGWELTWNVTPGDGNADGDGNPMGLEDPDAPPELIAAAGDVSGHVLDYDRIPQLEIQVSAQNAAALEAQPFTYVQANLVFEGRTYGPVGLRLKGQNSFLPFSQKPSLRINVGEYVEDAEFWGLEDLTLNNMRSDFSMMHERLAYWVMRQAGVPASRANHLRLTVNGQNYGLYTNLETVKKKMIGRWFSDAEGSLFEATDVDFVASMVPRYELEAGPDDRSRLLGVASALTMPSADAAISAAGQHADLNAFRRFWAVCSVIGQFDSFPYSMPGDDYFVYSDPTSGRLHFAPWGMDETFYSGSHDVTGVSSVLARRCRESPACWNAYVQQVWDVLALTESMDLAGERVRVMQQIAPYVAADTRKPYTDAQVAQSQSDLYWFITERRQKLSTMLTPPSP